MGASGSKRGVSAEALKPGDLLLYRNKRTTTTGFELPPAVVRGVAASQQGNYFSVQKYGVPGWTNIGIVTQYDQKLYVIEGSVEGLVVFPLERRVRYLNSTGHTIGARCFEGALGAHTQKTLETATLAAFEGVSWRSHLRSLAARKRKQNDNSSALVEQNGIGLAPIASGGSEEEEEEEHTKSDGDEEGQGAGTGLGEPLTGKFLKSKKLRIETSQLQPVGTPLMDFLDEYVPMVLHRLQGAVQRIPAQLELEARRAFITCDANQDGYVEPAEIDKILRDMRGKSVSKKTVDSIIAAMDTDADGKISVHEFLRAFEALPHDHVPIEHDVDAMVSAESIAVLLELMGVLRRRPIQQPGTFSPANNDMKEFVKVHTTTRRSPGTWNYFKEFGISSPQNLPIAGESEEEQLLASGKKVKPHGVRGKTGLVLLPPSKEGTVALIDGTICDLYFYQPTAFSSKHPITLPLAIGKYGEEVPVNDGKNLYMQKQQPKRSGACSCRRSKPTRETVDMQSSQLVKVF